MSTCLTPFMVRNPKFKGSDLFIPVPCGKCPACLARRTSAWSFRLVQHDKIARSSQFVTLTYENAPMSPNGFMTLVKADFQLFMKRLRMLQFGNSRSDIRYYCAGEYGGRTMRPHFHVILFNADRELVQRAWPHGFVHFGNVSAASVGYTAKYINKGKTIPIHGRDDRLPECSMMSKGLGANYMTSQMVAYHKADISRAFVTLEGGVKASMPRYYRDKIFSDDDKLVQQRLIVESHLKRERDDMESYRVKFGSMVGYDRSKYEAVKASLELFKGLISNKRDKV